MLKPGEGVRLLVNDALIEDSCRVFPADQVEINPVEYLEPFRVEVSVSSDRMRAKARFIPARRITHKIIDQPFAPVLVIEGRRCEVATVSGSLDQLKKRTGRLERYDSSGALQHVGPVVRRHWAGPAGLRGTGSRAAGEGQVFRTGGIGPGALAAAEKPMQTFLR